MPNRSARPVTDRRASARPAPARALCAAVVVAGMIAPGCAAVRQKWDEAVATKIDNPAVPAAPVRVPGAVVGEDPGPAGPAPTVQLAGGNAGLPGGVRTTGLTGESYAAATAPGAPGGGAPQHFDDADVVAVVNGIPLLAGDLLQFETNLNVARDRILNAPTPDEAVPGGPPPLTEPQRTALMGQVDRARAAMLAERLPAKIEEALLANRLRRSLKAEQIAQIDAAVETMFDQTRLPELIKESNAKSVAAGLPPVRTKAELRTLMAAGGMDLDSVVAAWKPQQMAMAYIEQNTGMSSIRISRQEIADYYDAHRADFTPPRAARWEQIEVAYTDDESKPAALDLLEVAAGDLRRGRPFGEVAAEYSRGPKAADGGRWDWTAPEGLTEQPLAAALWEQPVGVVGAVVDCPLSPEGFRRAGRITSSASSNAAARARPRWTSCGTKSKRSSNQSAANSPSPT